MYRSRDNSSGSETSTSFERSVNTVEGSTGTGPGLWDYEVLSSSGPLPHSLVTLFPYNFPGDRDYGDMKGEVRPASLVLPPL